MKSVRTCSLIAPLSLFVASSALAGPLQLADLFDDFTTATATATAGDTFAENGWTATQSVGGAAITYDTDLNGSGVAGYTGSDSGFELPFISADGVFDGLTANAGELGFHPGAGAPGDLVIRWTAGQAYSEIDFEYSFRRGQTANGPVGLAVRLNDGGSYQAFDINDGSVSTTTISNTLNYVDIEAGDFIEVIIYDAGNIASDQSFGNFTVSTVPEPGSLALLGLGGLVVGTRRRRD